MIFFFGLGRHTNSKTVGFSANYKNVCDISYVAHKALIPKSVASQGNDLVYLWVKVSKFLSYRTISQDSFKITHLSHGMNCAFELSMASALRLE